MDSTLFIQFVAVVLFGACLAHSWRTEGQRAAIQWFFIGYIFALLLISLLVVIGQMAFAPDMIVFGAAPSVTVMLFPAVFYIAYLVAKRYVEPTDLRAMGYLVFLTTPWLMLILDALALGSGWWSYPSESLSFLDGIPFYLPFAWGVAGAGFFLMVGRIRKIRFRGNGQFFALIIATPLLAGLTILLIALIQVLVDTIATIAGLAVMYALLTILFLGLPMAIFFNIPRIRPQPTRIPSRKKK